MRAFVFPILFFSINFYSHLTIYCSCHYCYGCDACVFFSVSLYIYLLLFCHSCHHCRCVLCSFSFSFLFLLYKYILYNVFTVILSPPQLPVLSLAQRKCVRFIIISLS